MGTIQIDGSTPKLTIGNATAEDATILFDGAAQDFYIALDDSADDLLIGLGSTVGTTPAIAIDENLKVNIPVTTASTSTSTGSLTTGGGAGIGADLYVGDDAYLITDSAVLGFGADKDTLLTHTDGTGLTLNSTNKLCFNDASQFIQGSSATVLSIGATDEIDLTATAVDLNGTLDVSGTTALIGTEISGQLQLNITSGQDTESGDANILLKTTQTTTTWLAMLDKNLTSNATGLILRTGASGNTGSMIAVESNNSSLGGSSNDTEFKVRGDGEAYCDGSFNGGGADYAEVFESTDGAAIPHGTTVVLVDNKIRASTASDSAESIIGVVKPSNTSSIVGNVKLNWNKKYLQDDFGVAQKETVPNINYPDIEGEPETITRRVLNPDFIEQEYIERKDRDEWNVIGLVGQVPMLKNQKTGDRWIKMRDISGSVEEWYIR